MMGRRTSSCVICENSNLASICAKCVSYRLKDHNTQLGALRSHRDVLYSRLIESLVAKGKADEQLNWRVLKNEKLNMLRRKLQQTRQKLLDGKAKVEKVSNHMKAEFELLESAFVALKKNHMEQVEKFYPDHRSTLNLKLMAVTSERLHKQSVVIKQISKLFPLRKVVVDGDRKDGSSGQYDQICNARLPRGIDTHSVPPNELAASLGYMVQLLNLIVHNLAVPALHNPGFAGSCSRIWQRDSYWKARPSDRRNEYPLFIPQQNYWSRNVEHSWSDKSSSNFGVASIESERIEYPGSSGSIGTDYSPISPNFAESHKDLQKGISLLKRSVACISAYCYNLLCLDVPPDATTFEAFAKLLVILSSSKEVRSIYTMACSRSSKQVQQLNKSIWNVNSSTSATTLLESAHSQPSMRYIDTPDSTVSFLYGTESSSVGENESLIEEWNLVEHPAYPPQSQWENIEHWT